MLDILTYDFFQNALIGGVLISAIASIFGGYVVLRKEANINHSIANFLFLGIAISLFFQGDYYLFAFVFSILVALLIYIIESTEFITRESTKEIISQLGMAGGIFAISFFDSLQIDIFSFLFGNILLIQKIDLYILLSMLLITFRMYLKFGKNMRAVVLQSDIARSQGIKVGYYNFFFLLGLSFFIAISIKLFGILLIGAFLIIPTNSAKMIAKSMKQTLFFAFMYSVGAVILGTFVSHFLSSSTGATIVCVLLILFFITLFYKKYFR